MCKTYREPKCLQVLKLTQLQVYLKAYIVVMLRLTCGSLQGLHNLQAYIKLTGSLGLQTYTKLTWSLALQDGVSLHNKQYKFNVHNSNVHQ